MHKYSKVVYKDYKNIINYLHAFIYFLLFFLEINFDTFTFSPALSLALILANQANN